VVGFGNHHIAFSSLMLDYINSPPQRFELCFSRLRQEGRVRKRAFYSRGELESSSVGRKKTLYSSYFYYDGLLDCGKSYAAMRGHKSQKKKFKISFRKRNLNYAQVTLARGKKPLVTITQEFPSIQALGQRNGREPQIAPLLLFFPHQPA